MAVVGNPRQKIPTRPWPLAIASLDDTVGTALCRARLLDDPRHSNSQRNKSAERKNGARRPRLDHITNRSD